VANEPSAGYDGAELYELVRRLIRDHGFATHDFVLAGSTRLWVEGIVYTLSDIDIVARGATWVTAFKLAQTIGHGGVDWGEYTGDPIAQLFGRRINVSERWLRWRDRTDALIDSADVIEGLPHLPLEEVVAYKRELRRPKDIEHLAQIRQLDVRT
jgi:hypothetical protein